MLAPELDSFYESQMYNNFGELGEAVNHLKDECKPSPVILLTLLRSQRFCRLSLICVTADLKKRETLSEIKEQQSLEKLKEFIETDLGEHKKLQMTMAKHINICDELTKLVSGRR